MAQFVNITTTTQVFIKRDTAQIIHQLVKDCQPMDQIVIMSNGGFDNIHQRLIFAMQPDLWLMRPQFKQSLQVNELFFRVFNAGKFQS